MKKRILLIILIGIPTFLGGGIIGSSVTFFYMRENFQKGAILLKEATFIMQVEAIQDLKKGSTKKAFDYIRSMNEYGLLKMKYGSDRIFLSSPLIKSACDDLIQNPTSLFTGEKESLSKVKKVCRNLLLNQSN